MDANGNSYDFSTKLLHLAWHPTENSIACAAANSLYMYYAQEQGVSQGKILFPFVFWEVAFGYSCYSLFPATVKKSEEGRVIILKCGFTRFPYRVWIRLPESQRKSDCPLFLSLSSDSFLGGRIDIFLRYYGSLHLGLDMVVCDYSSPVSKRKTGRPVKRGLMSKLPRKGLFCPARTRYGHARFVLLGYCCILRLVNVVYHFY